MRSAATGFRAWLMQRLSALLMLAFLLYVLGHFAFDPPRSYEAWRGWVLSPAVSLATAVFFAALLLHAWVGLRDVAMDYVRPAFYRVCLLAALGCGLVAAGTWVLRILLVARI